MSPRSRVLILFSLSGAFASGLLHAAPVTPEDVRVITREWVEAEKALSREAIEWKEQKVLLRDLTSVAKRRIEAMERRLAEGNEQMNQEEQERRALLEAAAEARNRSAQIHRFLAEAEPSLRALFARLPEPLQEELRPLYQRIPETSEKHQMSLGERMRNLVGMLTGIREFDGRITLSESVRPLPGSGEEAVFRILWVGLGQAYYSAPGDAGYGLPGDGGWTWHSQPDLATRIEEGMMLAESRGIAPRWLDLPVHLKEEAGQ